MALCIAYEEAIERELKAKYLNMTNRSKHAPHRFDLFNVGAVQNSLQFSYI